MARIVTLGEIMLRLSPKGYNRFVQAESFDVVYGGGEANVAVSLANFGHHSYFVSRLPKHEIGQAALNALRKYGVNTEYVQIGGERLGIYYLETGASIRPSKVIYDRANSAISEVDPYSFDFDSIFKEVDWFHFSGITPALSENAKSLTLEALKSAKKFGVTVSVDLNYRKKLWSKDVAQKTMKELMKYVDVCIGNEEDAEKVLGYKLGNTDVSKGELEINDYQTIMKQMQEDYNFKYVVTTLRESYSASKNGWSAMVYDGFEFYKARKYEIDIVDRVGGGDSFSAGFIHGLLVKNEKTYALDYAVAASALKHTIKGDFNLVSIEEVEALMNGDTSGRVQR